MNSDYSLDIAVATAVEPKPLLPPFDAATAAKLDYVPESPLHMWFYDDIEKDGWYAGTVQDSMDRSMRAYILFWERTAWKLVRLEHLWQERWQAILYKKNEDMERIRPVHYSGVGATAAIAICEAIKAASLADESLKGDSLQGDGKDVRSSAAESE